MERQTIGRDTILCLSLAERPGTFGSRFHNHLFDALGIDGVYKACATRDLEGAIRGLRALGVRGCALSMPFKEQVIPLLDALDASAEAVGAVNTIVHEPSGRLVGFNTDVLAVREVVRAWPRDAGLTQVAVRGSGGMARAVVAALADAGFTGTVVARNESAGRALAERFGFRWAPALSAHDTSAWLVNATPLGMQGTSDPSLPFEAELLDRPHVLGVLDVVAMPARTPFASAALERGLRVHTGDALLVTQGRAQFELYTGVRPSDAQVLEASRFALG